MGTGLFACSRGLCGWLNVCYDRTYERISRVVERFVVRSQSCSSGVVSVDGVDGDGSGSGG